MILDSSLHSALHSVYSPRSGDDPYDSGSATIDIAYSPRSGDDPDISVAVGLGTGYSPRSGDDPQQVQAELSDRMVLPT